MHEDAKKKVSSFVKDGALVAGQIAVAKWSNMLVKIVGHARYIVINCGYRVFVVLLCSSPLRGCFILTHFTHKSQRLSFSFSTLHSN